MRLMRVTRWQQFWKVDAPSGMIAQVWNGMISFGAAWFALAASETISVVGKDHTLPGVGSYVAQALDNGEGSRVGLAIFVMVTMVISVNSLFWRPITVWAERFRTAEGEFAEQHRSWFLQLLPRVAHLEEPVVQVLAYFPTNLLFPPRSHRPGSQRCQSELGMHLTHGTWCAVVRALQCDRRGQRHPRRSAGGGRQHADDGLAALEEPHSPGDLSPLRNWSNHLIRRCLERLHPAEMVHYGSTTLTAVGIGAYIQQATTEGDFTRKLLGTVLMSIYVVVINRLFWRRLYRYAQKHCAL